MFESICKTSAMAVLFGAGVDKMKSFTFEGYNFSPKTLAFLGHEIKSGNLKVEFDSVHKYSSYDYNTNTIYLHFYAPHSISRQAMIVHEATHAMFDFQAKKMDIATSESLAYIAQCIYARINDPNDDPEYRIYSEGDKDKVFEIGWEIAGKILNDGNINSDDVKNMRDAVSIHPFYSSTSLQSANFNGY